MRFGNTEETEYSLENCIEGFVMRIHIMGPAGSGKTTLARQLASSLNIPFYEMDYIAWEEGYPGIERPLETRLRDIEQIAAQPAWVAEGIFLTWTDELLCAADYIVWLDVPWPVTIKRIIIRRLRRSLARANPPSSLLKQFQFLKYIVTYYLGKKQKDTRRFIAKHLKVYDEKVRHLRYPSEVDAFFKSVLIQEQTDEHNTNC
jgi:adenylate kinase family enzyme